MSILSKKTFRSTLKFNSFIILNSVKSYENEINEALLDFLFFLRPKGIPCIDKSDIEYVFRNKEFKYCSIRYKTYKELIISINNFAKNKLTETTNQVNFVFKANENELLLDKLTEIYIIFESNIKNDNILFYSELGERNTFFSVFYSDR